MRYLTNKNIPQSIVSRLRAVGHDVLSARESMTGQSDMAVLARATVECRVLVTFDKDCGELAFRSHLPAVSGIILIRTGHRGRDQDVQRIFDLLQSRGDWPGAFLTLGDDRIRRWPLP